MTLLDSTDPLAEAYDLALVDLDGVAYRGPEPIEHAASSLDAARARGMRLLFVTNNASREPETVAEHLSELGIPAGAEDVMTAAQAAATLLTEKVEAGAPVLVVGGAGLLTAVRGAGYRVVTSADDAPVAVVQGFSPDLGWRELAEAAYAIQRGALHIASNLDLTLPNERGLAPGNGSLVGVVVAATGVTPLSAGKPEPAMFRYAAERAGARAPLVVGDRLDTDLAGARAAGFPGLHVFTGVSQVPDVLLAHAAERPSFLGADLRSLLEAHRAPTSAEDGWWVLGSARARAVDGGLDLHDDEGVDPAALRIDLVRAAAAASWAAADAGRGPMPERIANLAVHIP